MDQASATAAEVTGSMMRLKLELEEKKRTVNVLQTALVSVYAQLCVSFHKPMTVFKFGYAFVIKT